MSTMFKFLLIFLLVLFSNFRGFTQTYHKNTKINEKGGLTIRAKPDLNAKIIKDNVETNFFTPHKFTDLKEGYYKFKLKLENYYSDSVDVVYFKNSEKEIIINLFPIKSEKLGKTKSNQIYEKEVVIEDEEKTKDIPVINEKIVEIREKPIIKKEKTVEKKENNIKTITKIESDNKEHIVPEKTEKVSKEETEKKYELAKLSIIGKDENEAIEKNLNIILNKIDIEMIYIEGGTFTMGSKFGNNNQRPEHLVKISSFYIAKYETTQEQWRIIMGNNPSFYGNCGKLCPVENVSWDEVQDFLKKLSDLTKKKYRLPTEAEWEYVATYGYDFDEEVQKEYTKTINNDKWFLENSTKQINNVGFKTPNNLGILDMSSGVFEWVSDWYAKYNVKVVENPVGQSYGKLKVIRGGSWSDFIKHYNLKFRYSLSNKERSKNIGFRVVREID